MPAAVGVDPGRWQHLRRVLSTRSLDKPDNRHGKRYEVLNLSRPGLDALV